MSGLRPFTVLSPVLIFAVTYTDRLTSVLPETRRSPARAGCLSCREVAVQVTQFALLGTNKNWPDYAALLSSASSLSRSGPIGEAQQRLRP